MPESDEVECAACGRRFIPAQEPRTMVRQDGDSLDVVFPRVLCLQCRERVKEDAVSSDYDDYRQERDLLMQDLADRAEVDRQRETVTRFVDLASAHGWKLREIASTLNLLHSYCWKTEKTDSAREASYLKRVARLADSLP